MGTYNELPDLRKQIKALTARVRALETASPLNSASIGAGGIRVLAGGSIKSADFDGSPPGDLGENGWYVGDGLAVFNTLDLRNGIIGPGALQNQTSWGWGNQFASNFSVTTTLQTIVSQAISVPDWAQSAIVFCSGSINAFNNRGSTDFLSIAQAIHTTTGNELFSQALAGSWGFASGSFAFFVESPGTTITVATKAQTTGGTWSANTSNFCSVSGMVIFFSNP